MKNVYILIISTLFLISCNDSKKLKDLEKRIYNVENNNKILSDSLNKFVKPFKIYEKIVLSELTKSPNQIILEYESLIKNYPNSFWKHEAVKRIKNVEKRRKYWSEKNGWKLPKKTPNIKVIEIIEPVVSCPGC